jgi:G:T-mismatch repair DNA endonuclease (very short patch repair protein)
VERNIQESKDKIAEKRAEFLSTSGYDPNARTNIELICRELLNSIGAEFQEQYKLSKFVYDFHIGGKFIEVNGDYWHCHPKMYTQSDPRQSVNIKRDKEKLDKVGQENMLYLWEDDLLHRPEICYRLIKSFLSGEHVPLHSYEVERRAITHE